MNYKKQVLNKAGLPPGSLIHVGKRIKGDIKISIIEYNALDHYEIESSTIEKTISLEDNSKISWINVDGLHNTEAISKIGVHFDIHGLLIEDILNTNHRPKAVELDEGLFVTLKNWRVSPSQKEIISEQISLIVGDTWLISFQEEESELFDNIQGRLRDPKSIIRQRSSDFLLYRLIDTIVDNYFFILEYFSEATEKLELRVLDNPDRSSLNEIQRLKKQLLNFKNTVRPLREALAFIQKDAAEFIQDINRGYFSDVFEHVLYINDSIETQKDILSSIMDLYMSGVSNKMNHVMQFLAIISTIFIPLTFIVGLYGMNFENIPELHWQNGYYMVWIIMVVMVVLMLLFFKRKKWL